MAKKLKDWLQIGVALGIFFGSFVFVAQQASDMAAASQDPALISITPRYHDDVNLVTCWTFSKGIACLPDYQLGKRF